MTSGSCGALQRRFRGEFVKASAEYAVERWKWVDDVGERLQRNAQLDREHELAHDLARTRSDHGNQQPVGRDHRSGLQTDDDSGGLARWLRGLPFNRDAGVPDHERDAIRLQVWPERGAGLWFFEPQERGSSLDHGHFRAETRERLPELHADRPPAEDRKRCRQLTRNRRLPVGPEVDSI